MNVGDLELLCGATGYRNRRTDHDDKFSSFLSFAKDGVGSDREPQPGEPTYMIQFVSHPDFPKPEDAKIVRCFRREGAGFVETPTTGEYRRANSYKNYKTHRGTGHPRGVFMELNLYVPLGGTSRHHTSTINGRQYARDSSHDGSGVPTKGPHWLA